MRAQISIVILNDNKETEYKNKFMWKSEWCHKLTTDREYLSLLQEHMCSYMFCVCVFS